jgi:putative redox protein
VQAEITWKGAVKFEAVEMVLIGTGGCSAYDVVHILKTGREPVDGCVAHLTAERAEEPPRVFTKIAMHFVVSGKGLSANKVGRAVALSAEKYCSASIMLTRGGVEVTHTFEVVESP